MLKDLCGQVLDGVRCVMKLNRTRRCADLSLPRRQYLVDD